MEADARAHREAGSIHAYSAPWPYPLLCLAWRLGWGGRRLIASRKADRRSTHVEDPADAGPALNDAELTTRLEPTAGASNGG